MMARVDKITSVLKGFVIVGGVVLVAGTLLLVVLIVMRGTENRPAEQVQRADAQNVAPLAEPGPLGRPLCEPGAPSSEPLRLALPAGARVEQVVPDGGCLILLGVDGAGRQFVALVDPLSGQRLSLLLIHTEP